MTLAEPTEQATDWTIGIRAFAASQETVDRPPAEVGIYRNLSALEGWLEKARKYCERPAPDHVRSADWLLDNAYQVSRAVRQLDEDLPPRFYRRLPALSAPAQGQCSKSVHPGAGSDGSSQAPGFDASAGGVPERLSGCLRADQRGALGLAIGDASGRAGSARGRVQPAQSGPGSRVPASSRIRAGCGPRRRDDGGRCLDHPDRRAGHQMDRRGRSDQPRRSGLGRGSGGRLSQDDTRDPQQVQIGRRGPGRACRLLGTRGGASGAEARTGGRSRPALGSCGVLADRRRAPGSGGCAWVPIAAGQRRSGVIWRLVDMRSMAAL